MTEEDRMRYITEGRVYGHLWATRVKNNAVALPTFDEMMEGLFKWYLSQIEVTMPRQKKLKIIVRIKEVFERLTKASKIGA